MQDKDEQCAGAAELNNKLLEVEHCGSYVHEMLDEERKRGWC
jgi:hypothetical protein